MGATLSTPLGGEGGQNKCFSQHSIVEGEEGQPLRVSEGQESHIMRINYSQPWATMGQGVRRVSEMDGTVAILQMKQLRLRTLQKKPMITLPGSGGAEVQIQV